MAGVHGQKNFHLDHDHAHAPPGLAAAAPPPHR